MRNDIKVNDELQIQKHFVINNAQLQGIFFFRCFKAANANEQEGAQLKKGAARTLLYIMVYYYDIYKICCCTCCVYILYGNKYTLTILYTYKNIINNSELYFTSIVAGV